MPSTLYSQLPRLARPHPSTPSLQNPKSFEDLEIEKIEAYHGLKSFHEVIELKVDTGQPEQTPIIMKRETFMDGTRYHVIEDADAAGKIETIGDGKFYYFIDHTKKTFNRGPADGAPFDAKANLLKAESHAFNLNIDSGMPFQVASDPAPIIESISTVKEGKTELRKVVATATSAKGNKLTIVQWFLPDRWILDRATVKEETKNSPMSAEVTVTVLDFDAKFKTNEFTFDPSHLKGYREAE